MLERIKEAVTETFGEKCPDFDANCHGCQAWAEVERLDCPPLSGKPMVTDATQLLEQGDRAHAALCRELRIQTSLVGDLTAALRRALSDAPAREVTVREAAQVLLSACPNPIFDDLKPVLIGEFSERIEVKNEDGDDESVDIPVSWTVTKEIISATLRALSQGGEA